MKKKLQKKGENVLWVLKKSSTFASAFRKEQHFNEEFFERFRYKQASSTKSLLR